MENQALKKRFEEGYELHSDAVFRYCFFRISNKETSLDLVQETFMRFWDALIQGKEIKNDRAFIFTIVKNLIIDYYRKKKSLSLDEMMEETEDSSFFLEDKNNANSELSSEARFVLEKIEELDSPSREVVYLRFVEGFKPKEIAEILDVSPNVVSVRIVRALERLRELTGYTEEHE